MVEISFRTDNAAFGEEDFEKRAEVSRILLEIAAAVESGKDHGPVMDLNGNRVGQWSLPRS